MAKSRGDFTDVLVNRGLLVPDQITEAKNLEKQTGAKLQDALVKLGYVGNDEIMSAIAANLATGEDNISFYGGVSARIQNLARVDGSNLRHVTP